MLKVILLFLLSFKASAKSEIARGILDILLRDIFTNVQTENDVHKNTSKGPTDIKISYDYDYIQTCKKVSKVLISSSHKAKINIDTPFDCDVEYHLLTREVHKLGGNTLFINHFKNKCNMHTYDSYAYLCK